MYLLRLIFILLKLILFNDPCTYSFTKNVKLKQMVEMATDSCHLAKLQVTL